MTRLFYATDVHGSERTFRKFLNGAKFYKVDHIIMGGDIAGKFLVPIVRERDNHYRVTLQERHRDLDGDSAVQAVQGAHRDAGLLPRDARGGRAARDAGGPGRHRPTVPAARRASAERWIAMADERLAGTSVKWYVTGGNDDPPTC